MIPAQNTKKYLVINQVSTTNGQTSAGYVDTAGYDYLVLSVYMTTADAASNKPGTLRILETDATQPSASTNYATISGFVSGTDYTIPSSITAATNITVPFFTFNVDTRNRKRYIRVEVSPVTTQSITAVADLTRAEAQPTSGLATGSVTG